VVLGEKGGAAGRNSDEPSLKMASDGAGEDPKLAWCRFATGVVEERPSVTVCGGTRRQQLLEVQLRRDSDKCG
jgi:hypothetical protein